MATGNKSNIYLPGPTVCGLYGMFDSDYGDASSGVMPRVTPSRVGGALLPFLCPRCDAAIDFSDEDRREHYHDARIVEGKQHDNHWCPTCGQKFRLNLTGRPLTTTPDKDGVAPAVVETIVVGSDGLLNFKRSVRGGRSLFNMRDFVAGIDAVAGC